MWILQVPGLVNRSSPSELVKKLLGNIRWYIMVVGDVVDDLPKSGRIRGLLQTLPRLCPILLIHEFLDRDGLPYGLFLSSSSNPNLLLLVMALLLAAAHGFTFVLFA